MNKTELIILIQNIQLLLLIKKIKIKYLEDKI